MGVQKFIDQVICGDSNYILKSIPDDTIDLIITSPPYFNQRDYGNNVSTIGDEDDVELYIDNIQNIFKKCVRIIKPSGSIIFNIGDKYKNSSLLLVPYRFAFKMTHNNDVKLINNITWVKPNPQPRQFKRRLVSSTEPFFHFVKTNKYKYYPNKFIDEERRIIKPKPNTNIGQKYFKDIEKSTELTKEEKEAAYKELNEVINEVKLGKINSFRMKIRGIQSAAYGGYEGGRKQHIENKGFTIIRMYGRKIKRDVVEHPILSKKYIKHPAIFPEYLVEQFIKLTTKPGDIVLDPFIGSGTVAAVAKKMNRHYIGIDINPKYCEIAKSRLEKSTTSSSNNIKEEKLSKYFNIQEEE